MKNLDLTHRNLCQLLSGQACPELRRRACPEFHRRADIALTPPLGPDDWRLLAATARREGVAPLLYRALNENEWLADALPDVQADLRQTYYATTARNLLLYRELSRILTALSPVPVVVLKGAALAATLYPSIGLRPMGDVDLLVPRGRLDQAVAAVRALGYARKVPERRPGLARLVTYEVNLDGGEHIHLHVELHWSLIGGEESRYRPRIDWFWEQVETADLPGVQALVLRPIAHLLYSAAHLALFHGEAHSPLRWFYDIHLLVTQEGHRIDWNELILRAQEFRWAPALRAALAGTAARFATPLPAGLLESLIKGVDSKDQALIQRKTRPQTLWERTRDKLACLSWRARLHLLLAIAIPSPSYVRCRYKPRPAWLWPLCYPCRWLDILREGLTTLWKIGKRRIEGVSKGEQGSGGAEEREARA